MDTIQRIRLIIGSIISPLMIPIMVYTTFLIFFGVQNYNSDATLTSVKTIFWLNYIITFVIGIPAFLLLRSKGWESLRNYVGLGIFIGLVLIITISNNFVYIFYIVFCVAGGLVGLIFWFIVFFQPETKRRHSRRTRRRR